MSARPRPPRSDVAVHIERLVLDGLPLAAGQAAQLQRAMTRELTRLLRQEAGRVGTAGDMPAVVAPAITWSTPFRPAEVGRQIARSVHRSLTQGS